MKSKNITHILWVGTLGSYEEGDFWPSCDIEASSYQELMTFAKKEAKDFRDNDGIQYYLTNIRKYTEKEEFAKKQRVKV